MVILFADGYRFHLTKHLSHLCDENGVLLITLFPNTTHITQPADVSVLSSLKVGWASRVGTWKNVTRYTLGTILTTVRKVRI